MIFIRELLDEFQSVRWIEGNVAGVPGEGWFLLETNPLPSHHSLSKIVVDIEKNRDLIVDDGKIYHYGECRASHSFPSEMNVVKKALQTIKPRTFKVAIHPGLEHYGGQPIAIAIDPLINYETFPDHPHLNTGDFLGDENYFIPESFCYLHNIAELYGQTAERYRRAFSFITIWLLRHMVWEETRKYQAKGYWIGPEEGQLRPIDFLRVLNPQGKCRCGSRAKYADCHMAADLRVALNPPSGFIPPQHYVKLMAYHIHLWNKRKIAQDAFYEQIKRQLHTSLVT